MSDLIDRPCRCSGCGAKSEPRLMGQTPIGWGRETEDLQGRYYCPDCATIHARVIVSWGYATSEDAS